MSTTRISAIDVNKLNSLIGQFVTDLSAAVHTGMVVIGGKLGLYKALPEDPSELSRAGTTDRDVAGTHGDTKSSGNCLTGRLKSRQFFVLRRRLVVAAVL